MKKYTQGGWKQEKKEVDILKTILTLPFVEAIVALVVGFLFYNFFPDNRTLAELTWILGPALSISRLALEKTIESKFTPLNNIMQQFSLINHDTYNTLTRIIQLYSQITEPDFIAIKNNVIRDTESRLSKLAYDKKSDELKSGEYFDWLFKFLDNAKSGSNIWAISMNLSIEWNESQEEDTFLELNLKAAKKGVRVERIFVIKENDIEQMMNNEYIKKQIMCKDKNIIPLYVTKEHLEEVDKSLLEMLGNGIIAIDNQVVLVDIASEEGFRGIVTMNSTEIQKWRECFEQLRVYAYDAKKLSSIPKNFKRLCKK